MNDQSIVAAKAALERGDLRQARSLAEAAIAQSDASPEAQHLMGVIECHSGHPDSGLDWFRRASEGDPENIAYLVSYARLLADMGGINEALELIDARSRRALERALDGGSASAISAANFTNVRELGVLLERSNQIDNLRRLLAAARDAGIAQEALGSLWASVALRDGQPEEAKRLLLADNSYFDDSHWDRLMTKVLDALSDHAGAFAAAEAMNRATIGYDEWRRRAAHYRAHIRSTARIVTPEWGSRIVHAKFDDGARDPAFVAGFPRSGTTLLDTFLMGHADTRVVEEGRMLELATGVVAESPGIDWLADNVDRARKTYLDDLSRHIPTTFGGLVVDKHPFTMLRLPVLHALFPGAKVIFAQRHPCDVVLSGFMQSFQLNNAMACFLDIRDAADLYDAAMTMWTRSRDALPQDVHTVIYERLIENPVAELRPAVEFLGLSWSDDLLDHQSTAKTRGLITTASFDQVVQPLNRAPSGRWRRYREQLEPVLPVLLPWAERLGYAD